MEEFVIKSRLPHLYWCEWRGVLANIEEASVYHHQAAHACLRRLLETADNDYDWEVVPLVEAQQKEAAK